MRSVVKPRECYEALLVRRSMPLAEVLTYFQKKNGKPDLEWASQFLYLIHQGGALVVEDAVGQQHPFASECLSEAENYSLVLNDVAVLDSYVPNGYLALAELSFPVESTPPEVYCALQYHSVFRVVGVRDGAADLAEKIRAFTQYFAYQMSTGNATKAAGFFSSLISDKNTAPLLQERLSEFEAGYGAISHFDQITIHTVYNGKGRNKKLFREMALPKGADRDQRRGESEFLLVGMHTPSGAMLSSVRLSLGVIEELGVLKIANINWHFE